MVRRPAGILFEFKSFPDSIVLNGPERASTITGVMAELWPKKRGDFCETELIVTVIAQIGKAWWRESWPASQMGWEGCITNSER